MIAAEPKPGIVPVPPVTNQMKEADIAPYIAPYVAAADAALAAVIKGVQDLFATLPAEKQSEVFAQLGEHLKKNDGLLYTKTIETMRSQAPFPGAGSLKGHPVWDDYQRIMQEMREQQRKEAELLYPDEEINE